MSIVGLGIDQVDIDRVRRAYERHGERFVRRVFTEGERDYARRAADPVPRLSARFAAKEAAAKALGTGIAAGVRFDQLEVTRDEAGAPRLEMHGRAAEIARRLGIASVHLSITHTPQSATAIVILES